MNRQDFTLTNHNFFIQYYESKGRDFFWRNDEITPFQSLVTEMLLRQTRADSVQKVWDKFFEKYSTPQLIVDANSHILKSLIADLGLKNQRTDALKSVCEWLGKEFNNKVPLKLELLLGGPHIGLYTAKAVRCFAFSKREEIVDVNILRFFARYFGINLENKDVRRNEWAWEKAKSFLPVTEFKKHNYGLLDFTAQICKSRGPKCDTCPISHGCEFYKQGIKYIKNRNE